MIILIGILISAPYNLNHHINITNHTFNMVCIINNIANKVQTEILLSN